MPSEEKRAYGRGYYAGSCGRWPLHRPPQPPNDIIATLMSAAMALRDAVDGELATLDEDDPWQSSLGKPLDGLDAATKAVGKWLTSDALELVNGKDDAE